MAINLNSGLPGNTTGNAIASGFVGERITWVTPPGNQALTASLVTWTNSDIVLSRGVWLITASVQMQHIPGYTAGDYGYVQARITDNTGVLLNNCDQIIQSRSSATINDSRLVGSVFLTTAVSLSSTTTYQIRAAVTGSVGSSTGSILNSSPTLSMFFAVRIA